MLQALGFAGLKAVNRGMEKDSVPMTPFALNLILTITMQGGLKLFDTSTPKKVLGIGGV